MTSTTSTNEPMWTLQQARALLVHLETVLEPTGFHVGLLGSVLLNTASNNDLDIVVYPRDSTNFSRNAAIVALQDAGLRRRCPTFYTHAIWRKKGSTDRKQVEVWITSEGQRIDVFWMQ